MTQATREAMAAENEALRRQLEATQAALDEVVANYTATLEGITAVQATITARRDDARLAALADEGTVRVYLAGKAFAYGDAANLIAGRIDGFGTRPEVPGR